MSDFNIESIRKYLHINSSILDAIPKPTETSADELSDLESLKSIEMEARLSVGKVNGKVLPIIRLIEENYWQDIPYSLTGLKRIAKKETLNNKAMEEYHNRLFDRIKKISNELVDERNARGLLEDKASCNFYLYQY